LHRPLGDTRLSTQIDSSATSTYTPSQIDGGNSPPFRYFKSTTHTPPSHAASPCRSLRLGSEVPGLAFRSLENDDAVRRRRVPLQRRRPVWSASRHCMSSIRFHPVIRRCLLHHSPHRSLPGFHTIPSRLLLQHTCQSGHIQARNMQAGAPRSPTHLPFTSRTGRSSAPFYSPCTSSSSSTAPPPHPSKPALPSPRTYSQRPPSSSVALYRSLKISSPSSPPTFSSSTSPPLPSSLYPVCDLSGSCPT
jgi:hypothetical protein